MIFEPVSLSDEDIYRIDDTGLDIVDRHRLRILAYCLISFKSIAQGSSFGPLPSEESRLNWCFSQDFFLKDRDFVQVFLNQLEGVENQFEQLALINEISPLELTLEHLIQESLRQKLDKPF